MKVFSIQSLFHTSQLIAAALIVSLSSAACGAQIELQDLASTATINLPEGTDPSTPGMVSLRRNNPAFSGQSPTVDHLEDMIQQWWYISVDGGPVQSIHELGNLQSATSAGNFTPGSPDRLTFSFDDGATKVAGRYQLDGSAYGVFKNKVSRVVNISNMSEAEMDIRFYSYTNLALTGLLSNNASTLTHPPTVDEKAAFNTTLGDRVRQWDAAPLNPEVDAVSDSVTFVNVEQDFVQVDDATALLNLIESGGTLTGQTSYDPAGFQTGENAAYAFQYNFTLAAGEGFVVGETLQVLPEPSSMTLLIGAATAVLARRRSRRC